MHITQETLSKITVFNKYAKYLKDLKRRETWDEICTRYEEMLHKQYPSLKRDITENMKYVRDKKVLMSMRAAQFSGNAIFKNNSRVYNCAYLPIDDYRAFSEVMFLLLGGTGVGYSVQFNHISDLPEIRVPTRSQKFLVGDSIEGWADAVRALTGAFFGMRSTLPAFDFSDIRPKGARLVTAGGKAPGPEPLKRCLFNIQTLLERKRTGEKLTSLEVHDIICYIADAVLAGGIRRAALISLFSADDEAMITAKAGHWWELNPQRGRANNSAVLLRHRSTEKFFLELWKKIELSGAGEPGIYFSNDANWGANPCCEIALRPYQFCNLTEINAGDLKDQEDFENRARVASFFGTLQAGFTDFHYLRPIWRHTTEKDRLIGVGITGICNGPIFEMDIRLGAAVVTKENERVAKILGINPAARSTTIKPSGTTSCVVGTSSGIHAWHSKYYTRNMQCAVGDDLYNFFSSTHPSLIKKMDLEPRSAVIGIPQKAPDMAVLREEESAIDLLERIKYFYLNWVRPGHRSGHNTNNVSATISIKPNEWEEVGKWMWENREYYNGLACLPYDGGTYKDAPFEEITEEQYKEKVQLIKESIDLTLLKEDDDQTTLAEELACSSGSCEIQ